MNRFDEGVAAALLPIRVVATRGSTPGYSDQSCSLRTNVNKAWVDGFPFLASIDRHKEDVIEKKL
jgi:hypothetical protein